jgi:DNA-binding response OmpR family regulator
MNKKIAIVEDDAPIREMYELELRKQGFDVKTAPDGTQGLALVEQFRPHLILLDLKMPDMDGEVVLSKLREQLWAKDIKVIILTNLGRSEAPDSLDELGISRYVVKVEQTPSKVLEMVNEILFPPPSP